VEHCVELTVAAAVVVVENVIGGKTVNLK